MPLFRSKYQDLYNEAQEKLKMVEAERDRLSSFVIQRTKERDLALADLNASYQKIFLLNEQIRSMSFRG